ncbi:hypothetical protein RHGRI_026154 [Rhododendron griersonianum]|uniref:Transposase n=1 Tax=Rhododendron griersonianum TaxID=479676 RepID=A0AAV6ISP6_9ERIC|nr:hypothetical protein RHGRI_026154 [Rhododendron griersonianum]
MVDLRCTLLMRVGGRLVRGLQSEYLNGVIAETKVDPDSFSFYELMDIIRQMGYGLTDSNGVTEHVTVYYKLQMPDIGLVNLTSHYDMLEMFAVHSSGKKYMVIDLYVDCPSVVESDEDREPEVEVIGRDSNTAADPSSLTELGGGLEIGNGQGGGELRGIEHVEEPIVDEEGKGDMEVAMEVAMEVVGGRGSGCGRMSTNTIVEQDMEVAMEVAMEMVCGRGNGNGRGRGGIGGKSGRGGIAVVSIATYLDKYQRPPTKVVTFPSPAWSHPVDEIRDALTCMPNSYNNDKFVSGKLRLTFRLINKLVHYNLNPHGSESTPSLNDGTLLFVFSRSEEKVDWAARIWDVMADFKNKGLSNANIPFSAMITKMCKEAGVKGEKRDNLGHHGCFKAIAKVTERKSSKMSHPSHEAGPSRPKARKGAARKEEWNEIIASKCEAIQAAQIQIETALRRGKRKMEKNTRYLKYCAEKIGVFTNEPYVPTVEDEQPTTSEEDEEDEEDEDEEDEDEEDEDEEESDLNNQGTFYLDFSQLMRVSSLLSVHNRIFHLHCAARDNLGLEEEMEEEEEKERRRREEKEKDKLISSNRVVYLGGDKRREEEDERREEEDEVEISWRW